MSKVGIYIFALFMGMTFIYATSIFDMKLKLNQCRQLAIKGVK